jgi:transcriptional regulator with AAA-type ATPase domain
LVVAVVLGTVAGESVTGSVVWGLLAAGAILWPIDIAGILHTGGEGATRSAAVADGLGLADGLARLRETAGEEETTYAFVGIGEDFVAVTLDDPTGMGDLTVVSVDAKPEVAAALSMLALEGGMFPRPMLLGGHNDDNDPFAELRVRLGFEAIVPVGGRARRAGVSTFVAAIRRDTAGVASTFALVDFIETVEEIDSPVFVSELIAMGSEAILRRARRAIREAGKSTRESSPPRRREAAKSAPVAAESTPSPIAPQAWLNHLTDELRRAYPVDDPDALDDREWLALAFLRESIKPALIIGEPSSGKEFLARAVHEAMWGEARRFATVDCALRPPSIIEVELFGDADESGLVQAIGKGTLLLKGASALGISRLENLVPRLCRSECRIVFAERYKGREEGIPSTVDRTIIKFCDDRNIHLSPLRERGADIPRFVQYFLHKAGMKYDVMVTAVEPDALAHLAGLELAGNFQELEALVSAAVLRSRSETVGLDDFGVEKPVLPAPAQQRPPAAPEPTSEREIEVTAQTELSLSASSAAAPADDEAEKALILAALDAVDGNRTKAAEALGYTRGKLLRRLKKYGLS